MIKNFDVNDIIGKTTGDFTVVDYDGFEYDKKQKRHYYIAKCDFCGCKKRIERSQFFRQGIKRCHEHRKNAHRLRAVYSSMHRRCEKVSDPRYANYGARGIKVCDEWSGKNGFGNFLKWAINSGYEPFVKRGECTLDRISIDKGYEPSNCRWVDNIVQMNNRTDNFYVTYRGKTQSVTSWGREIGIAPSTLYQRIKKLNWDVEKAMTQPVRQRR